ICLIIIIFKLTGAFICKSAHLGNRHKDIRNVIDNQMQIFRGAYCLFTAVLPLLKNAPNKVGSSGKIPGDNFF
ncbi:MAG: hypothetical protein LBV74_03700, partial [Tannerella sp.]|nr:hypothetical protein [Tannerella sp.]